MLYGIQVNLAVGGTAYNLKVLLEALEPNLAKDIGLQQFHILGLQSEGDTVLVGDAALTTGRYGYSLPAGNELILRTPRNVLCPTEFWALSSGTDVKLNVALVG